MLALEDFEGLLFAPLHEVASIAPEWRDRWRVVLHDGTVAHCPRAEPFLNPAHLQRVGDHWRDPAGFLYPYAPLPPAPQPPPDPLIPDLPCSPGQVRFLKRKGKNKCIWVTDVGDFAHNAPAEQVAPLHPGLIRYGGYHYLNRDRVRRIRHGEMSFELIFDDGSVGDSFQRIYEQKFAAQLGFPNLYHLEPFTHAYHGYRLRDYPVELFRASAEQLQAWFPDARLLIANLIYQALRFRQPGYGDSHRGFYYVPVYSTISRAGFLSKSDADDPFWRLYLRLLEELIGACRLFTYRQLGFADPEVGTIGQQRPDVLLVVEKESLRTTAQHVVSEFGTSMVVTGGAPSLLEMEYLAARLKPYEPIRLIFYVDYDPPGWTNADATGHHLQRYGVALQSQSVFLVTADRFTEEELQLFALPCSSLGASAELTRQWVKRSGGVHGKPLGIHANHLYPPERVLAAMKEAL